MGLAAIYVSETANINPGGAYSPEKTAREPAKFLLNRRSSTEDDANDGFKGQAGSIIGGFA